MAQTKILVAIASFGVNNDSYLACLIKEYQSMSFHVDIVVISNLQKEVGPGVELSIVDLRGKNPWSLPFAHKKLLASGVDHYDLFVYSEDDTLITEANLRAFQRVSRVLPETEIAGFFRFERTPRGELHFPDAHDHFHWDPASVRSRGEFKFAHFTNEHSACYALSRQQLRHAIDSGGFLVEPHSNGKYLLLETAATDPYTQCGLTKLVCVSHFEDFLVHHLPDKYVGIGLGLNGLEFQTQIDALLRIGQNGCRPVSLFQTETKLRYEYYSKNYYEPVTPAVLSAIPNNVRRVLSIGCGWGAIEAHLAQKGLRVAAVPLDDVIPSAAARAGVKLICSDFDGARKALEDERFQCILFSNVLHLVPNPVEILASFTDLLADGGVMILLSPNLPRILAYWRSRSNGLFSGAVNFDSTGVQPTSRRILRAWLRKAGLKVDRITNVLSRQGQSIGRFTLGLTDGILSTEFIVTASKA
jgi:2-polyprenyl-3-methyl-5-hydroxy-6-metoxy-1,4-benzoquinol methylase